MGEIVAESRILVWGLACGLVVSVLGNLILAQRFMESQMLSHDLSLAYDDLLQSYEELEETYTPKPPISKDQAIDIALEYGQWNETSPEGMEVTASLEYYMSSKTAKEFQFHRLHEVIAHMSDYGPDGTCRGGNIIIIPSGRDCITFRYCWVIVILPEDMPSPVGKPSYWVDASTGEVVFDCHFCF